MPKKGNRMFVQGINRGSSRPPGGNWQLRDVVLIPVKQRGMFELMDMLNNRSIHNILHIYNQIKKAA